MTEAYPLTWPAGRPRTPGYQVESSRFDTTQDVAQRALKLEVERLSGRDLIISTNIPLRRDGLPYASYKITDAGVAVYFTYKGKQRCFACDKWSKVGDNMQAIRKTIEALRGIGRWGTGDMVEAAFTGFDALPPPSYAPPAPRWHVVLGVHPDMSLQQCEAAYRDLAHKHHPDKGGSAQAMAGINAAIAEARKLKS